MDPIWVIPNHTCTVSLPFFFCRNAQINRLPLYRVTAGETHCLLKSEVITWSMKKNLVGHVMKGILLPNYIGIIINRDRDPYRNQPVFLDTSTFLSVDGHLGSFGSRRSWDSQTSLLITIPTIIGGSLPESKPLGPKLTTQTISWFSPVKKKTRCNPKDPWDFLFLPTFVWCLWWI